MVTLSTTGSNDYIVVAIVDFYSTPPHVTSITDSAGAVAWQSTPRFVSAPFDSGTMVLEEWYGIADAALSSDTIAIHLIAPEWAGHAIAFGVSGTSGFDSSSGLVSSAVDTPPSANASPSVSSVSTTSSPDFVFALQANGEMLGLVAGKINGQTATNIQEFSGSGTQGFTAEYSVSSTPLSASSCNFGTSTEYWGIACDALVQSSATSTTSTSATSSSSTSTTTSSSSSTTSTTNTTSTSSSTTSTTTTTSTPGGSIGPYNYLISTTAVAGVPYYYAYDPNGGLVFGGQSNAGGIVGTDAASVINSAIAATAAENGGLVVLAHGVYTITKSVDLFEGVWLEGANMGWSQTNNGVTIQTKGNYPAIVFLHYGTGNSQLFFGQLSDLELVGSGNNAYTNNDGISSTDNGTPPAFDFYINHVAITQFYSGVYANGGAKLRIADSTIEGNTMYGLYLWNMYLADMNDLYIRTNGLGNGGFGLVLNDASAQLENSQVILNAGGVEIYSTGDCGVCSAIISNNIFHTDTDTNNVGADISLIGNSTYPLNAIITGNSFVKEGLVPAYDLIASNASGVIVTGNDFVSNSYGTAVFYGTGTNSITFEANLGYGS